MIEENVNALLKELEGGNPFGEKVTLVAATKTRTAEEINRALAAGITDVGENRVQEFTAKYGEVHGGNRHFIGHLQTNKVKYLIGKTYLYHSVDRFELARELALRSVRAGVTSDVLVQINAGSEESKGGFELEEGLSAFETLCNTEGLRVKGFMAMLPLSGDTAMLASLCKKMRELFERAREKSADVCYLSMGMSGDWRLCVENGSNMIRLGTAIFGEREYR